ncbi:hypothetical protein CWB68_09495 [Pseudoalteromonas sp. S979]|nr:hypothetical protein J139_04480 [Pseudoalteromonas agarivorans S816]TMS68365.1 hypothetical protein CWB86_12620 [Pseudoalteromonas sp. S1731]TMS69603.1 hypothetical protein CWB83_03000 [Pseudoalteromonas sp. S1691]TMS73436.1 hypothetical protein CWB88_11660 [Pseudoalteromonas sp. S1941]TMS76345.1 hypothetical protein CWB82_16980 [Pseudoalteromonas sp. S1690]TMS86938.1 hypothetical protein CWB70_02515 [Pseudoalteromonas sp. S981]TMS89166.1 hypothetical protein CWB69_10755 [Pseudoalteromonas
MVNFVFLKYALLILVMIRILQIIIKVRYNASRDYLKGKLLTHLCKAFKSKSDEQLAGIIHKAR